MNPTITGKIKTSSYMFIITSVGSKSVKNTHSFARLFGFDIVGILNVLK